MPRSDSLNKAAFVELNLFTRGVRNALCSRRLVPDHFVEWPPSCLRIFSALKLANSLLRF